MNDLVSKCSDERCLFKSADAPLPPSFNTVTEETREGKGLWEKCSHCDLVINRSGVAPEQVVSFYNDVYQKKNSFQRGETVSPRRHFEIRLESIRPRADYLLQHANRDTLVFELGAGTAELLHLLKPQVRRCVANELCQEYVDFAVKELGIEASSSDYLELVPAEKWDLAICVGTIDHIYNPRQFVEKIFADVKPGGLFYIEVPNDRQALKEFLPGINAKSFRRYMYQAAHYYSFTFETLAALLEQTGFAIEDRFTRHDYTLINYLNWYFTGKPQQSIGEAKSRSQIFAGTSAFEAEMNELLIEFDARFRETINRNLAGESLCVLARKPKN